MLQELTAATGAHTWAIGSLLFFFIVFTAIAARVITRRASHYERQAQLPLDELGNERDGGK